MGMDVYTYGWLTTDCYKAWSVTTVSAGLCIVIGIACSFIPGPGWVGAAVAFTAGTAIGYGSTTLKKQWIGY